MCIDFVLKNELFFKLRALHSIFSLAEPRSLKMACPREWFIREPSDLFLLSSILLFICCCSNHNLFEWYFYFCFAFSSSIPNDTFLLRSPILMLQNLLISMLSTCAKDETWLLVHSLYMTLQCFVVLYSRLSKFRWDIIWLPFGPLR